MRQLQGRASGQRIGLTGGIGSGKSTVARLLIGHGAALIDADAISRSVTASGGAAIDSVAKQFGLQAINSAGDMNRDFIRALVFSDADARRALEAIIHPLVSAETERQAEAAARAGSPCTVFDIPLLVESRRWRQQLDLVVVVDCSEATQVSRVIAREAVRHVGGAGWTVEAVQKVIAGQASRAVRRAAADACIHNEGLSLEALALAVDLLRPRFGL